MVNKKISNYTEETTPAGTDLALIDQGAGAYKKIQLSNLLDYGDVSIPNGYLYLEQSNVIRWTSDGSPTGTIRSQIDSNSSDDLKLKTGAASAIGLIIDTSQNVDAPNGTLSEGGVRVATGDGTTGGSASAGAGNQYVEISIAGTTYKVLHDGTV
jgi:hypothetical protein